MVEVNYVTVLVAALASFAVGMLWYSPVLFGKQWMALAGITDKNMEEGKKNMARNMVLALVTSFVMAGVLYYVVSYTSAFYGDQYTMMGASLKAAVMMWVGFFATTQLGIVLWEGKPFKLYALNTSYSLVSLLVMALVIGLLG